MAVWMVKVHEPGTHPVATSACREIARENGTVTLEGLHSFAGQTFQRPESALLYPLDERNWS